MDNFRLNQLKWDVSNLNEILQVNRFRMITSNFRKSSIPYAKISYLNSVSNLGKDNSKKVRKEID